MPKGQLTPFPPEWLPLKTDYGWTAVKLRAGDGVGITGCDMPRTPDGRHVAFWRRRKDVAEAIENWAVHAQNASMAKRIDELESIIKKAGVGQLVGVS